MNSIRIEPSPSDSARFGRPIGRLTLDEAPSDLASFEAGIDDSGSDIVVLRYPASAVGLFQQLLRLKNYHAIYADTLVHWLWKAHSDDETRLPDTTVSVKPVASVDLRQKVHTVFENYESHYAANPLLDHAAALEGYTEWVQGMMARGQGGCIEILDKDGLSAGWLIVDYSVSPADIRLGGIEPSHRGRGHYRELILEAMRMSLSRGCRELVISTQAYNTAVIGTWAKLGWRPDKVITTVHLVRRGLLD